VIGGQDTITDVGLSTCMRLDVMNLTWESIQDMNMPRISPGTMQSWNCKCLYVFGGKNASIERFDFVL
jgi:hypothetical protein